ncbi:MoxR family ATPase [Arsenicitalea aurantiaca]|uniref:MoxR family ATPase n=1 Tax=Arsenicitalea aurantiaca TaxID=1783274 RepID=A0A433XAH0_9HYPH|nr:MoxR family ATPase [Arsenicitalea aurantiaca]RUT31052.1 MoxR family ATPase [Arsenicitalea aurantiaca]
MPAHAQSTDPALNPVPAAGNAELERLLVALRETRESIGRLVLGQGEVVEQLLIGLIAGGHVLLEGAPGVGKTLLVRTLATATGLSFSRIQFTPDLMPADITGSMVLVPDETGRNSLQFQPGPVFSQLLLADEINRATPRTQAALLEAMQERTISAAGRSMPLPNPFFVLATQNPIEMEGTYTLPEAQIDRFLFRIDVAYPTEEILTTILEATTGNAEAQLTRTLPPEDILALQKLVRAVPIAEHVRRAIARLSLMTQPHSGLATSEVNRFVRFGLSPRGAQSLVLAAKAHALFAGRYNVAFEDVEAVLMPASRHRVQLNFEGIAEEVKLEAMVTTLFQTARRQVS